MGFGEGLRGLPGAQQGAAIFNRRPNKTGDFKSPLLDDFQSPA
jgi:hypothetical protein